MVANVVWMLTCVVHTSLCVWGVWMFAGLHISLITGIPNTWWHAKPHTVILEHVKTCVPIVSWALLARTLYSKSDLKKALDGVWARWPPEVPSNLNYISIYKLTTGFLVPSSNAPWCCLQRQNIGLNSFEISSILASSVFLCANRI